MCAISCASTLATCDSLVAFSSTPRWIQIGPPGSAKALISRESATATLYGYFGPVATRARRRVDVADVADDGRVGELRRLLADLRVGLLADGDLLLDGHQRDGATERRGRA